MKHTALKIASALFVSTFVFSAVHAEEAEEFTYGLKTDKMIIPMEENAYQAQTTPYFNGFSFYPASPAFFPAFPQNYFFGGFGQGMSFSPVAMMPTPFQRGFRHF